METGERKSSRPELKRSISLFQAVMYGVGLILGAGIYVLIGDTAEIAGNAMWISFIIAAVIATFTGLSYAELSSIFPRSAAEYVFVKKAFGSDFVAFIVGCLIVFVALVAAATVAIGFSGYFSVFFPHIPQIVFAIGLVAVLSFVNFYGITESVWMNVAFTLLELAGLVTIIVAGIFLAAPDVDINYFEVPEVTPPFAMVGVILAATGLIFFAYFGFENMANIAEETKNPTKVIPKALLISIIITTIIYVLVGVSALGLVGWEALAASDAPLATAASKVFGKNGTFMLSIIALFATSNTALMMLISGSRIIYGIAKDGAFPPKLARVHRSRKTPWIAVIVAMVVACSTIAASSGSISTVANVAVFGIFIVYGFVNFSLILLRYRQPGIPRPFSSPVKVGKFPVFAGLGLAASVAMLFQFSSTVMITGLSVVGACALLYGMVGRNKKASYDDAEM